MHCMQTLLCMRCVYYCSRLDCISVQVLTDISKQSLGVKWLWDILSTKFLSLLIVVMRWRLFQIELTCSSTSALSTSPCSRRTSSAAWLVFRTWLFVSVRNLTTRGRRWEGTIWCIESGSSWQYIAMWGTCSISSARTLGSARKKWFQSDICGQWHNLTDRKWMECESIRISGSIWHWPISRWNRREGAVFTICRSLEEIRPDLNKQYAARPASQRYVGQNSSSLGTVAVKRTCVRTCISHLQRSNICQLLSSAHTRKYLWRRNRWANDFPMNRPSRP